MTISRLLEAIRELEVVVPEFQREYVWSLEQAKELMVSLFHNYPTGSILVWETNQPPEIKNNAVKTDKVGWIKVLLDGQQRLTTLYLLLKGSIPPYYTETDIEHDPRHLHFNLQTGEFEYFQRQKMESSPYWKKVTDCFTEDFDALSILENLTIPDSQEKLSIGQQINKNLNRLRKILDIDYFVQAVPQEANIDKAIDVFDRVNSRGTKLTDAELVLTHIAGKWSQVRRQMKEKMLEYKDIGFEFDLDFLTRCMVVLLTKSALYEKMTDDVYTRLTESDYKDTWKRLVKILDYLIPILKNSAYLDGSSEMSTTNVLVPIVAYLATKPDNAFQGKDKNSFIYWMFLGILWARYSGQTDQRLDRDVYLATQTTNPVSGLVKEIEDQRGRIEIKSADLEGRGANHPLHRMLYVLAKYNKAIDWANGGSLQDTLGDYYSIQSHHIFPQAVLYRNGYDGENLLDKKKVNEIANRAFITRDANFDILDRNPAEYLKEVHTKYPDALKQQLIPMDSSLWNVKRYEDFLIARRTKIADAVNEFLESLKNAGAKESELVDYRAIITSGENNYVEFKSSLRWDYEKEQTNKLLEHVVAKTLAAFMNAEGGRLFIGIKDDGTILGLNKDYQTVHNKNKDGFLLQLTQIISNYLGKEFHEYAQSQIISLEKKDVCVVEITNSDVPVFVKNEGKEEFFIRAGSSSQPMNMREAHEYISKHWE